MCDTTARSNSLWWANLAPAAIHFGVANVIQMLEPALCGGPTLHPLYFMSVQPSCDTHARSSSLWCTTPAPTVFHFGVASLWYKCSIQFSVVDQPCSHCISFRCSPCDTHARSKSMVYQPCTHGISLGCSQCVIQQLDQILCGVPIWHAL